MHRSGSAVKNCKLPLAICSIAICCIAKGAAAQDQRMNGLLVEFPESNPVDLGIGWNSRISDKVPRVCIDFVKAERGYQDKRLQFEVVTDHQSLATALKISVSAKFRSVAGGGGSASVDFARQTKLSSTATNMAVLAEVYQSPIYVSPKVGQTATDVPSVAAKDGTVDLSSLYAGNAVSLKSDMRSLAAKNPAEFYRQCGDSFVAVIHQGARLVGNIVFSDTSREERESIEASASGGAAMWSVQGNLSHSMERFNSSNRLSVNFAQFGGSGGTFPLNREGLLKAIEQLPDASKAAPKPFSMIVQRYDSLPSWPGTIGATELTDLEVIANVGWQLESLLYFVDESLYKSGWLLKFDTKRADVQKVYDDVLAERSAIRTDAIKCAKTSDCNREKWQAWSDLKYRKRLPLRGSLSDLNYAVGEGSLESMIDALAAARTAYWIEGPSRVRCKNEGVCIPQSQIVQSQREIAAKIRSSIQ